MNNAVGKAVMEATCCAVWDAVNKSMHDAVYYVARYDVEEEVDDAVWVAVGYAVYDAVGKVISD